MSGSVFDSTREYFAYRELKATYEYLLEQVVSNKTKYIYNYTNSQLKTGKMGTLSFAEPSPLQYSLIQPSYTFHYDFFVVHKVALQLVSLIISVRVKIDLFNRDLGITLDKSFLLASAISGQKIRLIMHENCSILTPPSIREKKIKLQFSFAIQMFLSFEKVVYLGHKMSCSLK